jgi:ATP-dependent exoDNAse (exonuclease V) beta subunit
VTALAGGKPAPRGPEEIAEIPASRLQACADQYATLRELARSASARQVLEAVWRHCQEHVRLTPSEERATGVVRATFEGVIAQLAGADPAHLDDLVNALDRYLADDYRELPVADQPVRGAVQVMTIHRAKGLGFAAVFLLGWNERGGSGPSFDDTWGIRGLRVGGQDPKGTLCRFLDKVGGRLPGAEGADPDDESLRLAYVGVTRAQRFLCVTRATDRRGKPPRYPAESYFEGVARVPAEVSPVADHSVSLVRPTPAPAPAPCAPRAPELLRVSFTQLRRLEQCPRAWLLYRQAPGGWKPAGGWEPAEAGDETSGAEVGSRFHRFVAAHYRGATPDIAGKIEGLPPEEAARLRGLIAAFLGSDWARLTEPAAAEQPVTLARRVGETTVLLGGVVDLLLPDSGQLVDFKTERRMTPETRADHALQMLIYREALAAGGPPPPRAVLLHATPEGLETVPLSDEEVAAQAPRLEGLLEKLVAYAAGKPAEAGRGAHCQWCAFREMCGEG